MRISREDRQSTDSSCSTGSKESTMSFDELTEPLHKRWLKDGRRESHDALDSDNRERTRAGRLLSSLSRAFLVVRPFALGWLAMMVLVHAIHVQTAQRHALTRRDHASRVSTIQPLTLVRNGTTTCSGTLLHHANHTLAPRLKACELESTLLDSASAEKLCRARCHALPVCIGYVLSKYESGRQSTCRLSKCRAPILASNGKNTTIIRICRKVGERRATGSAHVPARVGSGGTSE
jgi:hypothetical protein